MESCVFNLYLVLVISSESMDFYALISTIEMTCQSSQFNWQSKFDTAWQGRLLYNGLYQSCQIWQTEQLHQLLEVMMERVYLIMNMPM